MRLTRLINLAALSLLMGSGIGCTRPPANPAKLNAELLQAARKGDTGSVQRLLQQGANIESRDQGGSTVLGVALEFGHAETVRVLLEKGANAVSGGLNAQDALLEAARMGNAGEVDLLLRRGADLKIKNEALLAVGTSEPTVIEASPSEAAEQIQRQQKEKPADAVDDPGMHWAEAARLLLASGAELEARDEEGNTPLIRAATFGGTDVVELLLKKGADAEARESHGMTPLIAAACDCAVIDMPDTLYSVKLLLEKGVDINAVDKRGRTALMTAAAYGRAPIVQVLLNKGARVDVKDRHGDTALLLSVPGSGYPAADAVELLLVGGANIQARNNDGDTALMLASKGGEEEVKIVRLLLDKGADVASKNKRGRTSLDIALKNRRTEIVALLRKAMRSR